MKYGGLNEQEALALITSIRPRTQDRQPRGFDRSGQGRGPGDLEPPPVKHLRRRPEDNHRRPGLFRYSKRTSICRKRMERNARASRPWTEERTSSSGILDDKSARRLFRKEALALSQISHPNIETIYDFRHPG